MADRPADKRNRKIQLRGADFDEAVSPRAIPGDPGYTYAPGDSPDDKKRQRRKRGGKGKGSAARRAARRAAQREQRNSSRGVQEG